MSDFNLRALVREVCDNSTMTDPATLAKEVSRRIGRNQQRDALEQALPTIVQHVISRGRGSQTPPGGQPSNEAHGAPAAGRSRKVAGIRETWRRMLRDRINIGPEPAAWKFLADCTVEDLTYAEQLRRDHARSNLASADRLASLRELLIQHGVATVAELPDDTLGGALGDAA